MTREKASQMLTSKLAESQDAVCQLKQLVENHVASEREKNKRVSVNTIISNMLLSHKDAVIVICCVYIHHTVRISVKNLFNLNFSFPLS